MKLSYITIYGVIFLFSCKERQDYTNKSPAQYSSIKGKLLYEDSIGNIYLKVKEDFVGTDSVYDVYYKEVGIGDSLVNLKDIIDSKTFVKIQNSAFFFKDKKHVYVHQQYPATYPPIKIIDISQNDAVIINESYIKDSKNTYWLGIKLLHTNSKDFHILKLEGINLGADNKNIYREQSILDYESFLELKSNKKIKDSLQKIYFPDKE